MNVSTTTTTTTDQKLCFACHEQSVKYPQTLKKKKWLSKSKEYIRIEKEIIRTDQQTATWSESTQG